MEKQNDCVNTSNVVNYYHRLGFPCTEALCISRTRFRLLIVPQKSFFKKSPIFKPADTFPIRHEYKQKEGVLSEEQTIVIGVICKSPHPPNSPPASQFTINGTLWESGPALTPRAKWKLSTYPDQFCRSVDTQVLLAREAPRCPYLKTGLPLFAAALHLYVYCFIPFRLSLKNEDPPNTEPAKLFKITTPKSFTVLPRLS